MPAVPFLDLSVSYAGMMNCPLIAIGGFAAASGGVRGGSKQALLFERGSKNFHSFGFPRWPGEKIRGGGE
jgi:hypothetical protein